MLDEGLSMGRGGIFRSRPLPRSQRRIRACVSRPVPLGRVAQRAAEAVERLRHCLVCPRDCGVDRMANKTAVCHTGRYAQVSSHFPHFGEESCLRGGRGSAN